MTKHTIKTELGGSVTVCPGMESGMVLLTCKQPGPIDEPEKIVYVRMTPAQAGALLFAIEQAAELLTEKQGAACAS